MEKAPIAQGAIGAFLSLRFSLVETLRLTLGHFHLDSVLPGPFILPDTGHLPGDQPSRGPSGDLEAIVLDPLGDKQRGSRRRDGRQLVAEIVIEGPEISRQLHPGFAVLVEFDIPVVDVHYVGAFYEGVEQVPSFGI